MTEFDEKESCEKSLECVLEYYNKFVDHIRANPLCSVVTATLVSSALTFCLKHHKNHKVDNDEIVRK